jgi:tol-pal system protein YbgF
MGLSTQLKPIKLSYFLLKGFFLSLPLVCPLGAGDSDMRETISNLIPRIEELENQINNGQGVKIDDKNPGAHVTPDDFERLRDEIRSLQDEVTRLRESVSQFESQRENRENADLPQNGSLKRIPPSSFESASSLDASAEKDDETESILKLLEQSAPGDEEEMDGSTRKKKGHKDNDLEKIRETATKHAQEIAPSLPVGNAEAQYNEAFALYDKQAYKEAERAFGYFIKTYPKDPLVAKAMYWKGESCLKQGNYKDAKVLFVSVYKKNPKGPKAPDSLLKLGEALAMQGKKEDACTAWLKLKTDFPHMTNEMKKQLAILKKKYGCDKSSDVAPKSAPKN